MPGTDRAETKSHLLCEYLQVQGHRIGALVGVLELSLKEGVLSGIHVRPLIALNSILATGTSGLQGCSQDPNAQLKCS